ncbi:heparinase II/III domain-containing protein [Kocuria sp.]|uniref:heparinase II/III domain-containing protein n=1 Tax=Kocuria sp. TaxID=1871328 RepID=UPI0026E01B4B|nr:heparinase II/III family protein [Kocuria sp.]MDO5617800.1 heparinase II/III family protein [Kocuria sp.]
MVNLQAAQRQVLGTNFRESKDEARLVRNLLNGSLRMSPHKAWQLPKTPTWTEDPFDDFNWQFQFHMLRWLDPLRRAGLKGNDDARAMWEHYARSWIEANPPGESKSKWAWVDMTDGIRAQELCFGLPLVGEQPWLVDSLEQHGEWLADPEHLQPGNHGMHQLNGLFVVGAVLQDQKFLDRAVSGIGEFLRAAWDQQGMNAEGAITYHRQNLTWWEDTLRRFDLEQIDRPEGAERLILVPEILAHETSPLGRFARIGDTDGSSPSLIEHPYTSYVTSQGRRGTPPASTTAVYDAGYAYVRSGWGQGERAFSDETYLTVLFGAQNKQHGHMDGTSLTCATRGVQWLDDQGRFHYGRDATRRYVVSRAAHNLLVLPSESPRKARSVALEKHQETESYVDFLLTDPSYDDVTIQRRVIYLKHWDLTAVLDTVQAEKSVQVEQRWHCGKGIEAKALSFGFSLGHGDQNFHIANLTSQTHRDIRRGLDNPMIGWTSAGWRKRAPIDVATTYDSGDQILMGSLLGTWCPPAVDLLKQAWADVQITAAVENLLPPSLLAPPWPGALETPRPTRPDQLTVDAEVVAPGVVRVIADGPHRYFAFDLFDAADAVTIGAWQGRGDFTVDVGKLKTPRIRVRHRSTPQEREQVVLDIKRRFTRTSPP